MPRKKIRVLIGDDHAIVRMGLRQIITDTDDMDVIDEAGDGADLLDKIRRLKPDVVIMDINMPGKSGWDVLLTARAEIPGLKAIVISISPEEDYAVKFFRAGASGYLNKTTAHKHLLQAIRIVASGEKYISPKVGQLLADDLGQPADKAAHATLSPREFQITLLIASGKTVKEIAGELALSVQTISTYRARILEKMGMKTNAQLTHYVFKNQLLK